MRKNYRYKLCIDFDKPIRFEDLPYLIANVLYPDEESIEHGATRLNLETELEGAAKNGAITVRNALSFGPSSLLVGAALKSSVVFVDDIKDFCDARFIELIDLKEKSDSSFREVKHKNKQILQEEAIIAALVEIGLEPKNLPNREPGKAGPKLDIRQICLKNRNLFTDSSFEAAWGRLRGRKEIVGAG